MKKIYVLIKTIGNAIEILAASPDKEFLKQMLKKEVKKHLDDKGYFDPDDEYDQDYREVLMHQLEANQEHWSDGDEEYELRYEIAETDFIQTPAKEPDPVKDPRVAVAEQIIGMLENNVLQECGMESFTGWCEDGNVFYDGGYDGMDEEGKQEAVRIMKKISQDLDEVSAELNMDLPL